MRLEAAPRRQTRAPGGRRAACARYRKSRARRGVLGAARSAPRPSSVASAEIIAEPPLGRGADRQTSRGRAATAEPHIGDEAAKSRASSNSASGATISGGSIRAISAASAASRASMTGNAPVEISTLARPNVAARCAVRSSDGEQTIGAAGLEQRSSVIVPGVTRRVTRGGRPPGCRAFGPPPGLRSARRRRRDGQGRSAGADIRRRGGSARRTSECRRPRCLPRCVSTIPSARDGDLRHPRRTFRRNRPSGRTAAIRIGGLDLAILRHHRRDFVAARFSRATRIPLLHGPVA